MHGSQNAIGVFCDLSKAFDCVHHDTLLRKLRHYGVQNMALGIIKSYLHHRVQCVDVNGAKSSGLSIELGVPQGSILGPFLFLVCINDLPYHLKGICDVVLFADDSSLIFKVDRNGQNFDNVNDALLQVTHWFTVNNLVLNAKKTKCIKFTLPNVKNLGPKIILDSNILETVDSTVFLVITVDKNLQWAAHIACLAGKLSSAAYAVRKLGNSLTWTHLDLSTLVILTALCHTVFYCGAKPQILLIFSYYRNKRFEPYTN